MVGVRLSVYGYLLLVVMALALAAVACGGASSGQDPLELTTPIPGGQGQDPLDTAPSAGGDSNDSDGDDSGGFLCFSPLLAPLAFVLFGLVFSGRPLIRRSRKRWLLSRGLVFSRRPASSDDLPEQRR